MLRYIIGITILTIGIIFVRVLSNGKILRKYQYAFWIAIPLYMILMPFVKIDVPVAEIWNNIFTSKTETASYEVTDDASPMVIEEGLQIDNEVHDTQTVVPVDIQNEQENDREPEQMPVNHARVSNVKTNVSKKIETILKKCSYCVSAILVVALIVYNSGFILYCRRKRKYIGRDSSSGLRIYSINHKGTPFLLFNKIYIDNDSINNEYVICHEACHYKHGDHLWVLIRYLVLFLNWYNPIIWIAFILSGRDCEYACDEEVLKAYGVDSSKDYARTLVGLPQQQSNTAVFILSTGMRGGYKMMKKRIINLKRPANNSRKAFALSMAAILLFTSCSFVNTSENARKIKADDPWFNTNIIEVDTGVEAGRNTSFPTSYYAGSDENYYVVLSSGQYEVPSDELEGLSWAEQKEKYGYRLISVVERKTNQTINIIDVKKDFSDINTESRIDDVYYLDGKITVKTESKERDYDPLTGKLLETRDRGEAAEAFFSSFYKIGEYDVELIMYQPQNMREHADINVKTPDGKTHTTEIKVENKDVYVYAVLELNDTKVLLPATINDYEYAFYELDLSTNELIKADPKEYAWMEEVAFSWCKRGSDGMVYYPTQHGISRINAETKTLEEVFRYDWCGLNRGLVVVPNFDLIECSENHFVLFGMYDSSNIYSGKKADKIHLIELDRADKNPNAGKTVLELFDPEDGWVDVNTGKAISVFNETNSKYFIEVTDRYNRGDYFDYSSGDENNDDTWELARINGRAEFSNQLAVDIMNNEGPDILMNVSGYGQLNNSNYLADLTPYVRNDIDKYYENIIEGSKTDGAIYQLPISFALEGILTKTENVGSSGKGFTLEEYEKFVDEVANGSDPIFLGQATYFSKLFGSMNDKFIVNGKVDLSGAEFAQLADYVKDNVREEGTSWNAQYTERTPGAEYTEYCYGIGGYFTAAMSIAPWGNGVSLAGIPSIDGRGPRFKPVCSVAISAQADNVDACGEFVKILLSEDVQTDIAMNDCFVINREAFRKAGDAAIDYYNNGGSAVSGGNGGSSGGLGRQFSIEDVDFVEGIILSCSRSCSEDASISIILIEEMPAYFLGQKDLDAVIKIAQNRIQKVLDERG